MRSHENPASDVSHVWSGPGRTVRQVYMVFLGLILASFGVSVSHTGDNFSDTWVATDALGRNVPTFPEVPAARADRTVGIFYFLWHGAHVKGGPFDVTRILAADPDAMQKPDSPLWGPLHAPHHWGESLFGLLPHQ